jgi:hypothetical protein
MPMDDAVINIKSLKDKTCEVLSEKLVRKNTKKIQCCSMIPPNLKLQ